MQYMPHVYSVNIYKGLRKGLSYMIDIALTY